MVKIVTFTLNKKQIQKKKEKGKMKTHKFTIKSKRVSKEFQKEFGKVLLIWQDRQKNVYEIMGLATVLECKKMTQKS